jgi:hypothetical protein
LAQAVVIPQAGQGRPKRTRNVHGGRPSRSCVPSPRGSGARHRATANGANSPTTTAAAVQRRHPTSLCGNVVLSSVTFVERRGEDSEKWFGPQGRFAAYFSE